MLQDYIKQLKFLPEIIEDQARRIVSICHKVDAIRLTFSLTIRM